MGDPNRGGKTNSLIEDPIHGFLRHGFLAEDPNRGRKTDSLISDPMDGFPMHGLQRHGFLGHGLLRHDGFLAKDPMECWQGFEADEIMTENHSNKNIHITA